MVPVLLARRPRCRFVAQHRQFFDPAYYRIVLFDQRGAGQSTPLGEYRDNTTPLLIDDIERLRELMGIDGLAGVWWLMGFHAGTGLRPRHPERCTGFVLRGIFLCTPSEIDWFLNGIQYSFPKNTPPSLTPFLRPE